MDLNASAPYEFLDLTDIDDNERKKLICTLYKTTTDEQNTFNEKKNKLKKSHGTTSTAIKDFNKYSRYESAKYVKNIAVLNLPQQYTANVKTHAEQTKTKVSYKPVGSNLNYTMAQHTPVLHHQQQQSQQSQQSQQQQLVNTQSQIQQQQAQQASSQNNNLNNYPPSHPSQTHTFNPVHSGGVYMSSHGVPPVGGAMYLSCPVPAAIPGNVYVNNVTANVNLHGYVTHPVPQYIPGTTPTFISGEVQQSLPHVPEQNTHLVQGTVQPSTRSTRRGRGRGNNGGGRRNDHNQRQQQASPAPLDVVNSPIDPQTMGTSAYPNYYPYAYQQAYFGTSAQNIGHPQAQQATGTPLYVTGHVPMFSGPQMYNYSPQIIYPIIAPDYQLVDEKGEEQPHPEAMLQPIWHAPMPIGYHEEFINPELVEDVNHNPSPLTSSDTPSMLSPNYPIYESQIHSSIEIQQQMNALHLYDPQQIPQQHLQTPEEQVQECSGIQSISQEVLDQPNMQTPIPVENISLDQSNTEAIVGKENVCNNNNEEILTEVPPAVITIDQTVSSPTNFVNNVPIQKKSININQVNVSELNPVNNIETNVLTYSNQNVPNIQQSQDEKSIGNKNEVNNSNVPSNTNDNSVQNTNINKTSWGGNQYKKSTASVSVTAIPSSTNKQNFISNVNKSVSTSVQVKSYGVMKAPSSIASNDVLERKSTSVQNVHSAETTKSVSVASTASAAIPQQLQDVKITTQAITGHKVDANITVASANKETNKIESENLLKSKKDETTSTTTSAVTLSSPATQQGPQSWASLFSNKPSVNSSSSSASAVPVTATASKKPVAKVFPFEGTTNFVPPSTPGNMSYSAASAQGIASQANMNAKVKVDSTSSSMSTYVKENADEWSLKFADFLTKYKIDYSPVSLRPRGLTNRSNYCYINAILQAFVGCPPFYNLMRSIPRQTPSLMNEKTNMPTINAMIQLVSEFSHLPAGARLTRREKGQKKDEFTTDLTCDPAFEPTAIYKLWNANRSDVEGRQEDAEEFLGYVLNKLNDEMLEIIKLIAKPNNEQNGDSNTDVDDGEDWQMIYNNRNKGSITRQTDFGRTPVSDIFRGELRSRLQREGEHSTDVIQPFFTLQLNIERAASVKEALEILVGRDQLEGVTCSKTNQEVIAWQQMTLEKLPVVLILHLKWFDYKSDGCTKILKTVDFPVELKIDTKILANKKYSQKQRLYRLFAVVYHDGKEASKGHYVTDVFHPGYLNWLRYDDSSVKPISENKVLRPRAPRVPYLLYYRRCDTVQPTQTIVNNK